MSRYKNLGGLMVNIVVWYGHLVSGVDIMNSDGSSEFTFQVEQCEIEAFERIHGFKLSKGYLPADSYIVFDDLVFVLTEDEPIPLEQSNSVPSGLYGYKDGMLYRIDTSVPPFPYHPIAQAP